MEIKINSLLTILFVVFLILRLCKVIAWSWWWVFSPLWIPALIFLLYFLWHLGRWAVKRYCK